MYVYIIVQNCVNVIMSLVISFRFPLVYTHPLVRQFIIESSPHQLSVSLLSVSN